VVTGEIKHRNYFNIILFHK